MSAMRDDGTASRFDPELIERLREEREVDIETWRGENLGPRRATIWVVVVGDTPYIRSWRGEAGRWYRDLRIETHGALHVAGRRIPVWAELVDDVETLRAVSAALEEKYRGDPATRAMVTPEVVPTTLRLLPA
jgi:hypothetical protein